MSKASRTQACGWLLPFLATSRAMCVCAAGGPTKETGMLWVWQIAVVTSPVDFSVSDGFDLSAVGVLLSPSDTLPAQTGLHTSEKRQGPYSACHVELCEK